MIQSTIDSNLKTTHLWIDQKDTHILPATPRVRISNTNRLAPNRRCCRTSRNGHLSVDPQNPSSSALLAGSVQNLIQQESCFKREALAKSKRQAGLASDSPSEDHEPIRQALSLRLRAEIPLDPIPAAGSFQRYLEQTNLRPQQVGQ